MNFLDSLEFGKKKNVCQDVTKWQIENPDKGLYVWGTGSVAEGVVKKCVEYGIRLSGLFVNVPKHNVDPRIKATQLPIFQLQELIESEKSFAVIVGHSRYELIAEIKKYAAVKKVWCFTSITRDDIGITEEFVKDNLQEFQITFHAFVDNLSRRNMIAYLNAKITGNNQYIIDVFDKPSTYFINDVVKLGNNEKYLDLGAYDGKSIASFIEACPSFEKIVAVEVQPQMCEHMREKFLTGNIVGGGTRIEIKNIGISDHIGTDCFHFNDQSTCLDNDVSGMLVEVTTLDALCEDFPGVSLMKVCIGNTIVPLIKGAERVLCKDKPKLAIAAGIDSRALLDYIPLIDSVSGGGYMYYLRFTNAMTEAMVLYAIPK